MEVARKMPTLDIEVHLDKHIDLLDKFMQLKKAANTVHTKSPDSLLKGSIPDLKQIYRHLHTK